MPALTISVAGHLCVLMARLPRNLKFEDALARLDAIVAAMESGEIGIEDSIAQYEEAMALAEHCRRVLDRADQRIKQIQLDAAGKAQATDFDAPSPRADADDDADDDSGDAVENE